MCTNLKWMDKCIPGHIPHEFSEIMARKSEVHPMKIVLRDPKYQKECVRILEELIPLLKSCYVEAGQAEAFNKAVIPVGGDQLVRVRMAEGRELKAGTHTRESRLETMSPDIIEFFHIQQDFLEVGLRQQH